MKSTVYYIGAGAIFLVLGIFMVAQTNKTNQRIESLTGTAHAASTEVISSVKFPIEFTFKRPAGRPTELFAEVTFSHFDHQEVACTVCHHTWDGGEDIESCSTEGCHSNFSAKNEPDSYFRAFHTKHSEISCRGCHMALTNAGEANLPSSPCGNNVCHPREARQ